MINVDTLIFVFYFNKYRYNNSNKQMGKLKEYYINNLTEEEIEEIYHHLLYESEQYEIKDSSTSQSEVDKDTHQTYPYDS